MKKSILKTGAVIAGLALVIGIGNNHKGPVVETAAVPETEGIKTIEDEAVPLAANLNQNAAISQEANEEVAKGLTTEEMISETKSPSVVSTEQVSEEEQPTAEGTPSKSMKVVDLGNGIYGYYDDAASAELLTKVNEVRGKVAQVLSPELDSVARERALACISDFSHNGMMTSSECLAKGQKDVATVVSSWNASDYHRDLICNTSYTQGGAACLWYDSGNGVMKSVWVLVLN